MNKRKYISPTKLQNPAKQLKLDEDRMLAAVTQSTVDKLILTFVIDAIQPFSICDGDNKAGAAFRNLVTGMQPRKSVMCSQTLKKRITELWSKAEGAIIEKISKIKYVATTADCWSSTRKYVFISILSYFSTLHILNVVIK